jgi:mannose-6-phosphate isomerase-like protein (cupin superfamily)
MEHYNTTYQVGDSDRRPWGSYEVIGVGVDERGERFCEKEIVLSPYKILSLQTHDFRRETWIVRKGEMTIIRNDERITVREGETIDIPRGSMHSMSNLSDQECVVYERQSGNICSEDDIVRYIDAYGRNSAKLPPGHQKSAAHFYAILEEIRSLEPPYRKAG